jgi:aspartate carbamoyltransferase catalytic subunit
VTAGSSRPFAHRHLLGIEPLAAPDIVQVLDLADAFLEISERPIKKVPTLRGRTVINLFLEPSTRTRTSFEIAAKRLSADAVNISGAASSTTKGETLIDTARNLEAMKPDVIVVRHACSGAAALIAERLARSPVAVINAGDGTHEHPSQALLDAATIRKAKGRIEGLEIAIVGDIDHSRVARSNLYALLRLGASLRLCAPRTMMPVGIERMLAREGTVKVRLCHRLEEAIEGADVIMMLRIQKERLGKVGLFPNTREYARYFGLSPKNIDRAKPDAIVMHPGPINRGVELDPALADGARSVILEQVTYGVAVRMALLYLLGGGGPAEAA